MNSTHESTEIYTWDANEVERFSIEKMDCFTALAMTGRSNEISGFMLYGRHYEECSLRRSNPENFGITSYLSGLLRNARNDRGGLS